MKKHWIGIVKWNDGTILRTEPFFEYDEGIKVWSSKFSFENKGKFEWIDYEKVEESKQKTIEEIIDFLQLEITERRDYSASKMCEVIIEFIENLKKEEEYTKEDMQVAWNSSEQNMRFQFSSSVYKNITFEQWFEQYKKK